LPGYNTNDTDTAAGFGSLASTDSFVGNIQGIDFSTWANNGAFSVEAWVNGGAQSTDAGIVTCGYGSGGEQFNLDTGGTGRGFRFAVRDANNVAHNASSSIVPNNAWQHLVGVCDEANGQVRLYVNGVSSATTTIANGIQMGTEPVSIGARRGNFSSTYTFNFIGAIDEVAIYNYPLSAVQVLNHYVTGTNPVVSIYIQRVGSNAMLLWSPGILQSATNVGGPYVDVPAATSPYTVVPSSARSFYRVRVR